MCGVGEKLCVDVVVGERNSKLLMKKDVIVVLVWKVLLLSW